MSYHKNNLGKFSDHVRSSADLDGYVPEEGDSPDDFRWPDHRFGVQINITDAEITAAQGGQGGSDEKVYIECPSSYDLDEITAEDIVRDGQIRTITSDERTEEWEEFVEAAIRETRIANASAARWQGTPHGELVKAAIKKSGRTQEEIAADLGISQAGLAMRLSRKSVSVETVDEIARVIGWSIPEIIGE